jgi:RNA polymerase sigma-70 factor, ECF subfamily
MTDRPTPRTPGDDLDAHEQSEPCACPRTLDEHVTNLLMRHGASIRRKLVYRYRSPEDAEEALHDALMRLRDALSDGAVIDDVQGWLLTVASRRLLDRLRKDRALRARHRDVSLLCVEFERSPEDAMLVRYRFGTLRLAFRSLTLFEQTCLRARADGLKLGQIGAREGLDLRRISETIQRAVHKLREAVRD